MNLNDLFDDQIDLPHPDAQRRYAQLIGLDQITERLDREGEILLDPKLLDTWSATHHGHRLAAVTRLWDRPPLFIFGGDVGTGKTTLAETFPDPIVRRHQLNGRVLRLSLRTRGGGTVGEMTRLLGAAFKYVVDLARSAGLSPTVLVIDEADALAESRASIQMHHEDRAGVNALIRGISQITAERLPVLVVMCTNRLAAIDPAIRRRAASEFRFERPGEPERRALLEALLADSGISSTDLDRLAKVTGETDDRTHGYTYSDLTHRVIPAAVLGAYPDRPLTYESLATAVDQIRPSPSFLEEPDD